MSALPFRFYGDPVEVVDEMRRLTDQAKRKAERERLNKARRIKALVKQAMRGVKR